MITMTLSQALEPAPMSPSRQYVLEAIDAIIDRSLVPDWAIDTMTSRFESQWSLRLDYRIRPHLRRLAAKPESELAMHVVAEALDDLEQGRLPRMFPLWPVWPAGSNDGGAL